MKKIILMLLISIILSTILSGTVMADTESGKCISVLVTVDWEGTQILNKNIVAMENFHKKFPEIPLVQFLNAEYYAKNSNNNKSITNKIKRTIGPNDELGIHLHGWKKLIVNSGVKYISKPTFDDGDVPITVYSKDDLVKIINRSREILTNNGFKLGNSYRAGSWMCDDNVRSALVEAGITHDYSPVATSLLEEELEGLEGYDLYTKLMQLWKGINTTSQPYKRTIKCKKLVEVPDNGALADYVTADDMVGIFEKNLNELKASPDNNRVVCIGFHQETATDDQNLESIEEAITSMIKIANHEGIKLRFITSRDL